MQLDHRVYCAQGPDYIQATQCGALNNLRFVFKDLFDVAGYVTGAGNPKWLTTHSKANHTSPLILSLLANGASCCGRVQTDELAYSLNGANIHYGTPINPVAPDCIPGGSSSGSAVAVANSDVEFAIGTDTGGSIRVPASYCGLYGLRPTLGKFSLEHCFELSKSFDTAGILSRDLSTLKLVYNQLVSNQLDEITPPFTATHTLVVDQTILTLMGAERQAILEQWCQSASIQINYVNVLATSGYQLAALSLMFRTIQGYEIIAQHGKWLDLWMDSLDPAIQKRAIWAKSISLMQYRAAQAQQATFTKWLHEELLTAGVLWVLPTTPGRPPQLDMPSNELAEYRSDLMGLTSLAGLSGMPQLHLPMRNIEAQPCGISLLGLPHSESDLIITAEKLIQGDAA